jgi:hypothetical protein
MNRARLHRGLRRGGLRLDERGLDSVRRRVGVSDYARAGVLSTLEGFGEDGVEGVRLDRSGFRLKPRRLSSSYD